MGRACFHEPGHEVPAVRACTDSKRNVFIHVSQVIPAKGPIRGYDRKPTECSASFLVEQIDAYVAAYFR